MIIQFRMPEIICVSIKTLDMQSRHCAFFQVMANIESDRNPIMELELPRLKIIKKLNPPFWASGGHSQTIMAHLIPSPTVHFSLEEFSVPLKDGDHLKIHTHKGPLPVMVSLFHGLSGNINSDYMQRTALVVENLGYSLALVNHRGVSSETSSEISLAKNPYHSGRGEDASDVFEWLHNKYPDHFHIGIGFSMSGSILLNLLTGRAGHIKPDAAITINAPLDLEKGALKLRQRLNRIYDLRFVSRLGRGLKTKYESGLISKKYPIPFWSTVYDFDRIFTGPATEFKTRENYYATCSMKTHLEKVDRPCFMLSAEDDPFVDVSDYLNSAKSPFIQTHIEATGGHVGYLGIDQKTGELYRWLDHFVAETLKIIVKQ